MDKVVVITGGTRGLGYETAKKFILENNKVIIAGRDSKRGETAQKELELYGECRYIPADVSIEIECQRLIDQVAELYGRIDILINNAAHIALRTSNENLHIIMDANLMKLKKSLEVNIIGAWQAIKYTSRIMADARKGLIINIGSVAGNLAIDCVPEYCISKAAVSMLTKCTALQLAGYGIRCICVSPGELNNSDADYIKPYYLNSDLNKVKAAEAIYAVSSDDFICLNGSEIFLDSGYTSFKGSWWKEKDLFFGYRFRRKIEEISLKYKKVLLFSTIHMESMKKIVDLIKSYIKNIIIFSNITYLQELQKSIAPTQIITYESTGPMEASQLMKQIFIIKQQIRPDCILLPCRGENGSGYENVYEVASKLGCDIYWLDINEGDVNKA